MAQTVKNLPAMQEAWVQSLGQEDPLEKGMVAHSSILSWRILWTEEFNPRDAQNVLVPLSVFCFPLVLQNKHLGKK